jgi:hypothetical protein
MGVSTPLYCNEICNKEIRTPDIFVTVMLNYLEVELGASPVATLGVPAIMRKDNIISNASMYEFMWLGKKKNGLLDGVASSHTDPLGNGTVLLLGLAENALGLERLVGRLEEAEERRMSNLIQTLAGGNFEKWLLDVKCLGYKCRQPVALA